MTQFLVTIYRKAFTDKISIANFPLTHAMCDKNDYENLDGSDVLVMLQVRYGKLMSVAIYQEDAEDSIRVFSFEADCHTARLKRDRQGGNTSIPFPNDNRRASRTYRLWWVVR